jgi:chromosome segregation ATPase
MSLWNWKTNRNQKTLLEQKDEIIDWYKQKEREYRNDLEQKERLIRELEKNQAEHQRLLEQKERLIGELKQKTAEFERMLEQKQAEYSTTLKQKETEWNRKLQAASSLQTPQPIPPSQPNLSQSQRRASNTTQSGISHFRMMERLSRRLQSRPQPSSSNQLQTSRRLTPSGMVPFNPLKYQRRG